MSHTPTPWISKGVVITGGTVARNERVAEVCYHAKIPWEANTSVIVERVNGWDALVAERDSLRDHVRILRDALTATTQAFTGEEVERAQAQALAALEATKVES